MGRDGTLAPSDASHFWYGDIVAVSETTAMGADEAGSADTDRTCSSQAVAGTANIPARNNRPPDGRMRGRRLGGVSGMRVPLAGCGIVPRRLRAGQPIRRSGQGSGSGSRNLCVRRMGTARAASMPGAQVLQAAQGGQYDGGGRECNPDNGQHVEHHAQHGRESRDWRASAGGGRQHTAPEKAWLDEQGCRDGQTQRSRTSPGVAASRDGGVQRSAQIDRVRPLPRMCGRRGDVSTICRIGMDHAAPAGLGWMEGVLFHSTA